MRSVEISLRRSGGISPGHIERYRIEIDPLDTVLSVLERLRATAVPGLVFRAACRQGMCGECAMTVEGEGVLACVTRVDLATRGGERLRIGPLRGFPTLRDLAVDRRSFFDRYAASMPWLVPKGGQPLSENLVPPDVAARTRGAEECVLCGICDAACPTVNGSGAFAGPAALLKCFSRVVDPRDGATRERLAWAKTNDAAYRCHSAFACIDACPKGLDPADAIMALRTRRTPRAP